MSTNPKRNDTAARDYDLIERIKKGDNRAFELLFERYVDKVHRHLNAIVASKADVDDLVQEVFVRVYRKIRTYKSQSTFSTWLYRVTRNVAISHIRKHAKRRWDDDFDETRFPCDDDTTVATPLSHTLQGEKVALANRFLARLSAHKQEVFVLHEVAGFTLEEIATMIDSPVYTVASRLRTARQEVKRSSQRFAAREAGLATGNTATLTRRSFAVAEVA